MDETITQLTELCELANNTPGSHIVIMDGEAELWYNERSGDCPIPGAPIVDISEILTSI